MTEAPSPQQPAARPIRTSRVWAGIGLAILGHVIALCVGLGSAGTGLVNYYVWIWFVVEFILFAACVAVGVVQIVRGDRGIGVGLLVGWAAGTVIFAGVCVALIAIVARSFGG
jgi:hypothetical protein